MERNASTWASAMPVAEELESKMAWEVRPVNTQATVFRQAVQQVVFHDFSGPQVVGDGHGVFLDHLMGGFPANARA